jgi:hypothetical protein
MRALGGQDHRARAHGSNAIGTIPYALGERYTEGNGERMRAVSETA